MEAVVPVFERSAVISSTRHSGITFCLAWRGGRVIWFTRVKCGSGGEYDMIEIEVKKKKPNPGAHCTSYHDLRPTTLFPMTTTANELWQDKLPRFQQ